MRKRAVWDMIKAAQVAYKPVALVLATKDIVEAQSLADRIAVLIQGGLHYIGTETELRKNLCKGIQIYIKMKPSLSQEIKTYHTIRTSIAQAFPGIRALNMNRYTMHYYLKQTAVLPDNTINNENKKDNTTNANNSKSPKDGDSKCQKTKKKGPKDEIRQQVKWSSMFEQMEKLRANFDFETYTVSIGGLEQIFYAFTKKYRLEEYNGTRTD